MYCNETMYNLLTIICIIMIIICNSIVISSTYKVCRTIRRLSTTSTYQNETTDHHQSVFYTNMRLAQLLHDSVMLQIIKANIPIKKNLSMATVLGRLIGYSIFEAVELCIILVRIYLIQ